jgi:hypothetical protein
MKKYIALLSFVAALFVGSCSPYTDEEPGGVEVQDLCGTWIVDLYVSLNEYYGVVDLDTLTKEELDELDDWANWFDGTSIVRTYNTANNDKDSLWFHDLSLVGKQFKVGANYGQLTFASDTVSSSDGALDAVVRYGAVFKGAATTRRGQKADSIITYVKYSNRPLTFMYTGYRYTGFADDEVLE